jgi:methylenetetrahydrofolate--tRNA-(uracil-5-)-methyltransferase
VLAAPKIELKGADKELERYFEGCMPIEALAARGERSLAFGPMRPVGLRDPRTRTPPLRRGAVAPGQCRGHALQHGRLPDQHRWGAQEEVLRLIPGLAHAKFERLGQMHRNTFINSPTLLHPTLQFKGS